MGRPDFFSTTSTCDNYNRCHIIAATAALVFGSILLASENFAFLELEMACFGLFWGAKLNVLVTTKAVKSHIKCTVKRAHVTKK